MDGTADGRHASIWRGWWSYEMGKSDRQWAEQAVAIGGSRYAAGCDIFRNFRGSGRTMGWPVMRRASKAFLRALHKTRAPNPFEDAARGRDPITSSGGSPVVDNPRPHGESLQQGATTSSKPSTAASPHGKGSAAASVAKSQIEPASAPPRSPPEANRGRGRPLITDERPWQLAGVSRRTWYRRGGKTT